MSFLNCNLVITSVTKLNLDIVSISGKLIILLHLNYKLFFIYLIITFMKKIITNSSQPFILIDSKFNDYEEFKETIYGWDVDFIQINNGNFFTLTKQLVLDKVHIAFYTLDQHMEQRGVAPKNMWTFVLPHINSTMYKFKHNNIDSNNTLQIYPPGSELNEVSFEGYKVYIYSIEQKHFESIAQFFGYTTLLKELFAIESIQLNLNEAEIFRTYIEIFLKEASSLKTTIFNQEKSNMMMTYFPQKLLEIISLYIIDTPRKRIKNCNIQFLQAKRIIQTELYYNIKISDISGAIGMSERNLRYLFEKELHTSPKQYLISLRLNKANQLLKDTHINLAVKDVAYTCGFNHLGQFSEKYKDFFGELPSDTLHKSIKV